MMGIEYFFQTLEGYAILRDVSSIMILIGALCYTEMLQNFKNIAQDFLTKVLTNLRKKNGYQERNRSQQRHIPNGLKCCRQVQNCEVYVNKCAC